MNAIIFANVIKGKLTFSNKKIMKDLNSAINYYYFIFLNLRENTI